MATNNAARLVQQAYESAKVVGMGQEPNSEQYTKGFNRLNDLVAFESSQGMKIFTNSTYLLTPLAGISLYSFGPTGTEVMNKPYRIDGCWYQDAQGNRRPLDMLTWNAWMKIPNATTPGAILQYFEDRQETVINLNLWQVPDDGAATGKVGVILREVLTPYTTLTDSIQFAPEWFLGFMWTLADELSLGQHETIQTRCAQNAAKYMGALRDQDVESGPVRFVYDGTGYARHYP